MMMKSRAGRLAVLLLGLVLGAPALAGAQADRDLMKMQVESYDLLEAGKLDQAREIYGKILKKDPGNPLALNNLGAILVKQGKSQEALGYFKQALPRAKDYKVKVNRVCDVGGQCLAFRPLMDAYADQELEPLIQLNIQLVKARLATKKD
jgi:tetratricopeptide (TPR) repeat protein